MLQTVEEAKKHDMQTKKHFYYLYSLSQEIY